MIHASGWRLRAITKEQNLSLPSLPGIAARHIRERPMTGWKLSDLRILLRDQIAGVITGFHRLQSTHLTKAVGFYG